MNEQEVKKCPKCNGEMEKGMLRGAPYWQKGKSLWGIGFGKRIFGYRCKDCSYVEFFVEKNSKEKKE